MSSHFSLPIEGFRTPAVEMQPYWRIRFSAPHQDVDRIFEQLIRITDLPYGKTDHNASVSASGYEYYRPMAGTPTGAEEDTRKRPDIVEMRFEIPPDEELLKQLIDVIYTFSSYYEQPISVEAILRSSTTGLDDSDNPHRWWNNDGDWKQSQDA